jgi:hydroxyacylglutathione hydrolase
MIFQRIKSEGISHNSYFIGSGSDAVVIDPRRDIQVYLDIAIQHGLRIKYIFETHRNEDYVIGSLELENHVDAEIFHGPGLPWKFGTTLEDGQEFSVGNVVIKAIHTPGHTLESMSYTLADRESGGAVIMVFTGDALFINEVGRTDFYGMQETPRMAALLYDSIFNKLLPLGDGVILCPAHGGGSICGTHISDRDESTLGIERVHNPALKLPSKDNFIKHKVAEKLEMAPYFKQMEKYNLEGLPILGCLPLPSPLSSSEFQQEIQRGAIVVDTSEPAAYGGAHIASSYNIWLEGLPSFAGWVLPYDKNILLVLEDDCRLDRAIKYFVRAGYDNIEGFIKGGIEGWYNAGLPMESLPLLSVHQLHERLSHDKGLLVLDARTDDEWKKGHIDGALHIFVGYLEDRLAEVPRDRPIAAICRTGHRASLAASILLRAGYRQIFNVPGSMGAWIAAGFPVAMD